MSETRRERLQRKLASRLAYGDGEMVITVSDAMTLLKLVSAAGGLDTTSLVHDHEGGCAACAMLDALDALNGVVS